MKNLPKKITNHDLELLTGLTVRWCQELAHQGLIPGPSDRGEWPIETVPAIIRYYQTQEPPDLQAAKLAEIQSRTVLNNQKSDLFHQKYVELHEVQKAWAWLAEAMRAIVQGADVPPRTKADLLANLAQIPVEKYLNEQPQEPHT